MTFNGFSNETYAFLYELSLNNNKEWFNLNRERFNSFVYVPMCSFAQELGLCVKSIDEEINTNVKNVVSRIYRDTRFSSDKSPYRSNMWLSFRYPGKPLSEDLTFWFEISPEGYTYGLGFYAADTQVMRKYRERLLADPVTFLELARELHACGFRYACDPYKRDRFPDAPEEIKQYINVKYFSWEFGSLKLSDTMSASFLDDVKRQYLALKPMYRFVRSFMQK